MRWEGFQEDVEELARAHCEYWDVDRWSVDAQLWQDGEYRLRVFTSRGRVDFWGVSLLRRYITGPTNDGFGHLKEWRHEDVTAVQNLSGWTTTEEGSSAEGEVSQARE